MRHTRTRAAIQFGMLLTALLFSAPVASAQESGAGRSRQTTDNERIIDVSQLSEAMQRATEPIGQRLQTSNLKERFEAVNDLLQQSKIDKRKLIDALQGLRGEIGAFTDDWDQVAAPLWDGQDAIGKTIDRVRSLLGQGEIGQASEKTEALLRNYDKRLSSLAKAIEREGDEARRERLKVVFANVLGLRDLTEKAGSINLGPAREAVYAKIVRALQGVEVQLTGTAFALEKARIVLVSQGEFVDAYTDIMTGLIDAEDLVAMLNGMKGSGFDFAGLVQGLGDLAEQGDQFALLMDGFAGRLAETIEGETARLAENLEADALSAGLDVDEAIKQYAGAKVAANKE